MEPAVSKAPSTSPASIPASTLDSHCTNAPDMFRPPVNRAMRLLDRSFFQKTVPLAAARVFELKELNNISKRLLKSKDLLVEQRIIPARVLESDRTEPYPWMSEKKQKGDKRCLLLRHGIKVDDKSTWSPTLQDLVDARSIELHPFPLKLDYSYWQYGDIIAAILPEKEMEEPPVGYSQVGHVAHFNFRNHVLPYRYLVGEILIDKANNIRSVINKVDDVGSTNQFRTFEYELLAGDPDMNVIVHEQKCEFAFDFAKVYWNPRLGTEHERMVRKLKQGEAVCDVMAGVGPFAMPAGKKKVFVRANDLNPHGYRQMQYIIERNKVEDFVKGYNMDGREFIKKATKSLYTEKRAEVVVTMKQKLPLTQQQQQHQQQKEQKQQSRKSKDGDRSPSPPSRRMLFKTTTLTCPRTFDHYIMNLPASAIEFLDAFIGLYAGEQSLFQPTTDRKLPLIHVYCFSTNSADISIDHRDICERVSERLGFTITPEDIGSEERELEIHGVRLVSPSKRMFCASFRLPAEVAFKEVQEEE
ncbi:hypothetical protein AJ80_05848 [Polytolypa hystricis UAMH7299]|uniref:tRNA (guanine(37)-N1)-methyltransferase n=1 Tax=Polytolypa hystricis (strain UAMH7299) TaxID=1447883 RepID=A0A2B7Y1S6_POLH7|nr:hypothetical protein AJ80_05848 [Polytolypa hystricis UAMH7299]